MQAMVAFQLSLLIGLILFIILVFCCIYHLRDLVIRDPVNIDTTTTDAQSPRVYEAQLEKFNWFDLVPIPNSTVNERLIV